MLAIKIEDSSGLVGVLSADETNFKTGSRGFQGQGKVKVGGKRYQAQIRLVEIGSKPTAEGVPENEETEAE